MLLRLGCHRAQGFFFGRPAPVQSAERFIVQPTFDVRPTS
jgi:EAL domain-containing protein (putative c-di-GMP-specific phosphodiesterase class I)